MKTATSWTSVLTPGDGDPRHGYNGYSNLRCRCDLCRAGNAEYTASIRATRRKRLAVDPTLVTHGLCSTYDNYECRCADCRRAHAAYARARHQNRKAAS